MNRRTIALLLLSLAALLQCRPAQAIAATAAADDRLAQLRDRFAARLNDILTLKAAGKVGETSDGTVDAVKEGVLEADSRRVINDENADRQELYGLIAQREGTTPQVVARRAALRHFQRANAGEFLKQDGVWRQKPSS